MPQSIWQDLREDHWSSHGYDSVIRFVRKMKRRGPEVAAVMEHPSGEEAQVGFFRGPVILDYTRGGWRHPSIFRIILSGCSHSYEEFLWRHVKVSFIRAYEGAFLDFGGVPRVIRLDNLKAGVARACLYAPDIGELYTAFAKGRGFVRLPWRPRHPQEQGVVERGGGYPKSNTLKGPKSDSLEELDGFLKHCWSRTVARVGIHGRTRKRVNTHFLEVEKPSLKPIPLERFRFSEVGTRSLHRDGYVEVNKPS